jgi:peptidoglycan/LPS O-acetylase OafA/YrhL
MPWMDALRGIAILLVILWHAPSIPSFLGFAVPPSFLSVGEFFLPFRMPALMLLSGLLLPRSLAKGLPRYYLGKVQFIVWPYIIWSAIHIEQFGVGYPIEDPRAWIATGYLWFIFFIALYYAVAPLFTRIPPWVVPVVFWIVAQLVPTGQLTDFFFYGGFFFAGNLVARQPGLLDAVLRRRWLVAVLAVVAIVFGVVSTQVDVNRMPVLALLSLAGIVAAIAATRVIGGSPLLRPLRFVGRTSIVYYVAHFPIMIVALKLFEQQVDAVTLVGILLLSALVGCTVLAWLRNVIPFRWLFQAPLLGLIPLPRRGADSPSDRHVSGQGDRRG